MRLLVTGATGFIGGHLTQRLIRDGHDVQAIARPASRLTTPEPEASQLKVHRQGGSTGELVDLVREINPDVVVHLASFYLSEHTSDDIERLVESNILFSLQLAEALSVNGIFRLINVGTSWQHHEDEDYNPVNLYAATKEAFRALLRYYVERYHIQVIHLELFDTFGPRDQRGKLFSLLRSLRETGDRLAMSPGDQRVDLVYIDDVVDAFVFALHRLQSDEVRVEETYAVTSGEPMRLRDLVAIYEEEIGETLDIDWGGRSYRAREVMHPWARGRTLPGWSPRISVREGIRRMLQADV